MGKRYKKGQIVNYLRTGAIYLLLEEKEISMLSPHFFKGSGYGFVAYVLHPGNTWPVKGRPVIEIFILKNSEYYEIVSDVSSSAGRAAFP
jgi:hypothetical protein